MAWTSPPKLNRSPTTADSRRICPKARQRAWWALRAFTSERVTPYGNVANGQVTASFAEEKDRTGRRGHDTSHNWSVQGADAGLYDNADIHAIRILLLEPTSETRKRTHYNHARERMRDSG